MLSWQSEIEDTQRCVIGIDDTQRCVIGIDDTQRCKYCDPLVALSAKPALVSLTVDLLIIPCWRKS
jgi:hypothetical protein